jgi:hypothetical protein
MLRTVAVGTALSCAWVLASWGQAEPSNPIQPDQSQQVQQSAPAEKRGDAPFQGPAGIDQPQQAPNAVDERGTEQAPFFVKVAPTEKSEEEREAERLKEDEHRENELWLTNYTGLLALFTLALVVVGTAQFFMFLLQLIYMRRTIRDTASAQSAYVSVEPEGLHPIIGGSTDGGNVVIGHVVFRNGGHLPAKELHWYVEIEEGEALRKDFPMPDDIAEFEGKNVLAPGSTMKFGTRQFTMPLEGFVFVWGAVKYLDGVNKKNYRTTKFCHRYNRKTFRRMNGGYGIPTDYARYNRYGNDAD